MDVRMYVMTHKSIADIGDDTYIPLHVGRALSDDLGYVGDDTGDNISDKNRNYCELTGMYWLWKNVDCDIVGICHYRRFFCENEKLLSKENIEKKLAEYDVILPFSGRTKDDITIREDYADKHFGKDLDVCRGVIEKRHPEYLAAFDFCMNSNLMSMANMWITKKETYDSYCEWLFDILFEAEKLIDITDYDDYQKRIWGFLAERLLKVWIIMQDFRVLEVEWRMIEVSDMKNANLKIDVLNKLIKLRVQPLLELYQSHALNEKDGLIEDFDCGDDFDGKIPVWVCWWQGEAEMPELVRFCYNSLLRNLPQNATVRFITFDNCLEYVNLSERIIKLHNEGNISPAHLADTLRTELLYRYGGMWIDPTYFVSQPIPESFLSQKFFTPKIKSTLFESDASRGLWSTNLFVSEKNNILFKYLTEAMRYYFEVYDKPDDYYLIDYLIAVGYDHIPAIKEVIDKAPYIDYEPLELQQYLASLDIDKAKEVVKTHPFSKLNRRAQCQKETVAKRQTVYGWLLENYEK